MALLGINPVSAPRPVQQEKGPSDFEKLVMGLQAAQSAFGIYADYTKLQDADAQREQQGAMEFERRIAQSGGLTPTGAASQGFVPVPQGLEPRFAEGAIDPTTGFPRGGEIQPVGLGMDITTREGRAEVTRPQQMIHRDLLKQLSAMTPDQQAEFLAAGTQNPKKIEAETALWNNYRSAPVTKATDQTYTNVMKIVNTAKEASAAGDISMLIAFMKAIDPGSTVREGEFATAQNAAGVGDRAKNIYNNLLRGTRLNPEQRADFVNQAYELMNAQLSSQRNVDERFTKFATEKGLRFAPEAWKLPPKPKGPVKAPPGGQKMSATQTPPDEGVLNQMWNDMSKVGGDFGNLWDQVYKDVTGGK